MDLAFVSFKVDVNPAPAKIFGQLRHCTPWRTHGATKQKDRSARRGRSMGPRGRMMAATDLLPESETENGDRD